MAAAGANQFCPGNCLAGFPHVKKKLSLRIAQNKVMQLGVFFHLCHI
jgi:hypothetical protein